MRNSFLILSFLAFSFLQAQETSFNVSSQDTIKLTKTDFKRIVAIKLYEAIILLEESPFIKKLQDERTGIKKQIRERERMIRKGTDDLDITTSQLKFFQGRLSGVDSIYEILSYQKSDTAWIEYSVIEKAHSTIVYFISSALDTKQCMVLNSNHEPETYIIKQTGSMPGVGLSYYFIKGTKRYFWAKRNWIS